MPKIVFWQKAKQSWPPPFIKSFAWVKCCISFIFEIMLLHSCCDSYFKGETQCMTIDTMQPEQSHRVGKKEPWISNSDSSFKVHIIEGSLLSLAGLCTPETCQSVYLNFPRLHWCVPVAHSVEWKQKWHNELICNKGACGCRDTILFSYSAAFIMMSNLLIHSSETLMFEIQSYHIVGSLLTSPMVERQGKGKRYSNINPFRKAKSPWPKLGMMYSTHSTWSSSLGGKNPVFFSGYLKPSNVFILWESLLFRPPSSDVPAPAMIFKRLIQTACEELTELKDKALASPSQNYNVRKLINSIYSHTYFNSHSFNNSLLWVYTISTFKVITFNNNQQTT